MVAIVVVVVGGGDVAFLAAAVVWMGVFEYKTTTASGIQSV